VAELGRPRPQVGRAGPTGDRGQTFEIAGAFTGMIQVDDSTRFTCFDWLTETTIISPLHRLVSRRTLVSFYL
jgi:hypothetical protein